MVARLLVAMHAFKGGRCRLQRFKGLRIMILSTTFAPIRNPGRCSQSTVAYLRPPLHLWFEKNFSRYDEDRWEMATNGLDHLTEHWSIHTDIKALIFIFAWKVLVPGLTPESCGQLESLP
jgi:hypothetical protein